MQRYEYKVVPAPRKGQRGKGVKGTEGKFAHALQLLMTQIDTMLDHLPLLIDEVLVGVGHQAIQGSRYLGFVDAPIFQGAGNLIDHIKQSMVLLVNQ